MKDVRTWLIVILGGFLIFIMWNKSKADEKHTAELAKYQAEKDSLIVVTDSIATTAQKWASITDTLKLENERLDSIATALNLEVTAKSRLIAKQKDLIVSLQGQVSTVVDSSGEEQQRVDFDIHRDGVAVKGFTLAPSGHVNLAVEHDPFTLDIHLTKTETGDFRKGLLDAPPWIQVQDWNLIIDEEKSLSHKNIFTRIKESIRAEIGIAIGPGGSAIPILLGTDTWKLGVIGTDTGLSYTVTKSFFGGT